MSLLNRSTSSIPSLAITVNGENKLDILNLNYQKYPETGRRAKGGAFWLSWLGLGPRHEAVKSLRFSQTIDGTEGFGTDESAE